MLILHIAYRISKAFTARLLNVCHKMESIISAVISHQFLLWSTIYGIHFFIVCSGCLFVCPAEKVVFEWYLRDVCLCHPYHGNYTSAGTCMGILFYANQKSFLRLRSGQETKNPNFISVFEFLLK